MMKTVTISCKVFCNKILAYCKDMCSMVSIPTYDIKDIFGFVEPYNCERIEIKVGQE